MWKCSVVCLLLLALNTFGANASVIPKSKAQIMIESIPEEGKFSRVPWFKIVYSQLFS